MQAASGKSHENPLSTKNAESAGNVAGGAKRTICVPVVGLWFAVAGSATTRAAATLAPTARRCLVMSPPFIARDHGGRRSQGALTALAAAIPTFCAVRHGVSVSGMEFGVLGPLEVLRDGRAIELPGSKRRALLALLIL